MTLKTSAYSFVLLLVLSLAVVTARAQTPRLVADTVRTDKAPSQPGSDTRVKGVQYNSPEEAAAALAAQKPLPLLAGVSVSADLCGLVLATCTPYGQYEAAARVNMKGRFFPTVEVGMGVSNHTNETTSLHYRVHSPYYRIGLDYNVAKNPRALGRILVGVRYGFSTYKFDIDGPNIADDIYGTSIPFAYTGVRGTNHWVEGVFGLEAKVWGILHLGWTFRYKVRLYNKRTAVDNSWYVPGYGKNDGHVLGGTFNVIFDI